MNIKLFLMSIWTPEFVLINELEKTFIITNKCIDDLLEKYSIPKPNIKNNLEGNLKEQRLIMAKSHKVRLDSLIGVLGFDKALKVGREELFKAGYMMGCDIKKRLKVKNINDTLIALRVIYNVLGINFIVEEKGTDMILRIKYCELSSLYSIDTCEIMSAVDEGVLKGLNNQLSMNFKAKITEGVDECVVCIKIKS